MKIVRSRCEWLLFLVLAVIMICSSATVFAEDLNGDTSAGDPTIVFSDEELDLDMSDLCSYYGNYNEECKAYYTLVLESGTAEFFSSSNKSVAKIEEEYESTVMIQLLKPGTVKIRAHNDEGNSVAVCTLNITASIKEIEIKAYKDDNYYYYYDDDEDPVIAPGKELKLKANSLPSFAPNPEVTWTSSDEKYATVDENGVVSLLERGPVSIKAETAEGISSTYYIKWSDTVTSGDYTYKVLDGNEAKIIAYNGDDKEIVIPETIDGYTVSSIGGRYNFELDYYSGEGVFENCDQLRKVTVPATIKTIGSRAFSQCDRLQTVILNCDADIPDRAFSSCSYLTSVQIKGHPKIIGKEAFEYCGRLVSITLPEGVEKICQGAFYSTALQKINFPQSLRIIEDGVFGGNCSIDTLNIGKNAEIIGRFGGIKRFIVDPQNSKYASRDGVLFNKTMDTLLLYPAYGTFYYSVPSGTKTIRSGAFTYIDTMYQLDFPETVQTIEENALPHSWNLSLLLPKSLKTIGANNMYSEDWKIYYRGSSADWGKIDIDIYGNDRYTHNKGIVHNYSKKALKPARTTVNCTYAEYPTFALTYDDGSAVKYEDARIYEESGSAASAYLNATGKGLSISINPYKKGTSSFCVVAGGLAKTLTVNVIGPTPISKVSVTSLPAREYTGKPIKNTSFELNLGSKYIGSDNYTVKYQNNTNVGIATVIITGKNNLTGTIKKTFKILPKTTWITTSTSGKKAVTLKWKKVSKQATGYQIQYGLKKNSKGAKKITIKNYKTTKKKIKKLRSNKKYYFRIRTYKKAGGKTYYSSWSDTYVTWPQ